jgi:hypothetical protein
MNTSAAESLWQWTVEALRQWQWRHTALALALGTLILGYKGDWPSLETLRHQQYLPVWTYNVVQFGFALVLAVGVANRAVDHGVRPIKAYGLAVLAVAVGGGWAIGKLLSLVLPSDATWTWINDLFHVIVVGLPIALGIAGYAHWRSARRTLALVRASEVERAHQRQQLQTARLLALQARVEPQLLFDTLQRIVALIDTSAAAADALLADLIAMLRALVPGANASASTVAREVALVQAYARVTGLPALAPPRLRLQTTAEAARASLAPMVLLPALCTLTAAASCDWQMLGERAGERLRLSVTPSPPSGSTARAALQAVDPLTLRERLTAVHGDGVTLRIEPAGLFIDLPYRDDDPSADR